MSPISPVTVAVDVMSGDRGAQECVPGALAALEADAGLTILAVGDSPLIEAEVSRLPPDARLRAGIVPAASVVGMDERPREAIRRRKDSSMRLAIDLVKSGRAAAAVSAGNTGALAAMAHFVLRTLAQVDRAPIMGAIPSAHGHTHMLDLGANTRATPEQLAQFAVMGSIVAASAYDVAEPRVGLLNIGEEDIKGHDVVQEAHELIRALPLRYVGFVEGHDIFSGKVDVVVTDGFTGNVALKSMEGLATLIVDRMRIEFARGPLDRLAGLAARPVLRRVAGALDPRRYNGACMVGLTSVVVKSHGSADRVAFARAVALAAHAARAELPRHIGGALAGRGG
jgi:glycerol-3-phosphate acyltransferase PlsX